MQKFINQKKRLLNYKIILFVVIIFPVFLFSQTSIEMQEINGIYMVPCKVNGLSLKFVLDTGASNVTISQTEALFMLKNGYLKKEDLGEKQNYNLANGNIAEGVIINLREIEVGGIILENIKASIILTQEAPLLLGQSALQKLGSYRIIDNKLILEDYKSINEKFSVLDDKNGFKSLKLGTSIVNLPSYFKTSKCTINKNKNITTCIIKDAPEDLKTVFDTKMDILIATLNLQSQTLTRIELVKVYKTTVKNDKPSFQIMNDYEDLLATYSKALGVKPNFFTQEFLDSQRIAAVEGSYAYWEGNNVILILGAEITNIKLTNEYNPEYIFNLKITYIKNDMESIESLFDKF